MSVDLKLIKTLRDRTNLGMNNCKLALEKSDGNIEAAIDLLKQWGELKGKEKAHRAATEGRISVFHNKALSSYGIAEFNCETDFLANSKEFADLVTTFTTLKSHLDTTFEEKRVALIAATGENVVLGRKELWNDTKHNSIVRWYTHPGDRLGVLIEVSFSEWNKEIVDFADEVAMQIAAMSPSVVSKDNIPAEMIVRQRAIFEAQLASEKKPEASWQKIIEGKFAKWRKDIVLEDQDSIKDSKKTISEMRQNLEKKLGVMIKIERFVRYAVGEMLAS